MAITNRAIGSVRYVVLVDDVPYVDPATGKVKTFQFDYTAKQFADSLESTNPAQKTTYRPDYEIEVSDDSLPPIDLPAGQPVNVTLVARNNAKVTATGFVTLIAQEEIGTAEFDLVVLP